VADEGRKTVGGPGQSTKNRSGGGLLATGLQWQRFKECVDVEKRLLSKSFGACIQ